MKKVIILAAIAATTVMASADTITQGWLGNGARRDNSGSVVRPNIDKLTRISDLVGAGVTIGKPGHSLTVTGGLNQAACLVLALPAGGKSVALPAGDNRTDDNCNWSGGVTNAQGRLIGNLTGQTFALALTLRLTNAPPRLDNPKISDKIKAVVRFISGQAPSPAGLLQLANMALAGEHVPIVSLDDIADAISTYLK